MDASFVAIAHHPTISKSSNPVAELVEINLPLGFAKRICPFPGSYGVGQEIQRLDGNQPDMPPICGDLEKAGFCVREGCPSKHPNMRCVRWHSFDHW